MKKLGKKSLIITLAAISAAVGITAGAVFAQDDGTEATPQLQRIALLERVCEIYEDNTGVAIDADSLKEAFVAAKDEIRDEAMAEHLERMIEEGKITSEEAEQFQDWMESRPDVNIPQCPFSGGGPAGRCGPRPGGLGMMCPRGGPGMTGPWGDFAPDTDSA